jgi:hypothetical protein
LAALATVAATSACLLCTLAHFSAQYAACTARASASGALVYFHCFAGVPESLIEMSRYPFGPPWAKVSQDGCGTVSHTDSCGPRWNVLM